MTTIKNTTQGPLRVPLPRGGKLHLGPMRTGEVHPAALEHPPLMNLIEDGKVEVIDGGDRELPHPIKKEQVTGRTAGHTTATIKQTGDR